MVLAAALTALAASELMVVSVTPVDGELRPRVGSRGGDVELFAQRARPGRVAFDVLLQVVGPGRREVTVLAQAESTDAELFVEGQAVSLFPIEVGRAVPGALITLRVEAERIDRQRADIPLTFQLSRPASPVVHTSELSFEALSNPRPTTFRRTP